MKRFICLLLLAIIGLSSCSLFKKNEARPAAKAPEAYLLFTNPKDVYPDGVEVYIDNKFAFIAMVAKFPFKDNRCPVRPGRLPLRVVYEGTTILQDTVTVKNKQVREIVLPTVTDIF